MTMVLEYPFKIFILIVVVLVIISIMWQFRDKIMEICFFPPCDGGKECNVQTVISKETEFTVDELNKYCNLCWEKNGAGNCIEDSVCYVLDLEEDFNHKIPWNSLPTKKYNYCFVTCNNTVSSLYVEYHSEGNGYIEISC